MFRYLIGDGSFTANYCNFKSTLLWRVIIDNNSYSIIMTNLIINGNAYQVEVDPATPLLWVIREQVGLTGTKFGCGIGQCGACTVQLDGIATRSCLTPVQAVIDKEVTTIEGLAPNAEELHPLQQIWIDEQVPQCGYCQSGQLMSAHALLSANASPTDEDIDQAMSGNICRCGMYSRIKKGIKRAAEEMAKESTLKTKSNG